MNEWDLLADPITDPIPVTEPDNATVDQLNQGSFIGRTLIRPVQREYKLDWVSGAGSRLIASAVGQILGTRCDSETGGGELPWRTEFGSKLYRLRNRLNSDAVLELARRYTAEALNRWAPWITVTAVKLSRQKSAGGEENVLSVRIYYKLKDQNTADNQVVAVELE